MALGGICVRNKLKKYENDGVVVAVCVLIIALLVGIEDLQLWKAIGMDPVGLAHSSWLLAQLH